MFKDSRPLDHEFDDLVLSGSLVHPAFDCLLERADNDRHEDVDQDYGNGDVEDEESDAGELIGLQDPTELKLPKQDREARLEAGDERTPVSQVQSEHQVKSHDEGQNEDDKDKNETEQFVETDFQRCPEKFDVSVEPKKLQERKHRGEEQECQQVAERLVDEGDILHWYVRVAVRVLKLFKDLRGQGHSDEVEYDRHVGEDDLNDFHIAPVALKL